MPNTISAAPTTIRSHDAHPGGLSPSPPSRLDTSRKIAVNAVSPISQPAKKARPVGRGRGVCNTNTAGMIDNGDSATTSASGMSSVSTDPDLSTGRRISEVGADFAHMDGAGLIDCRDELGSNDAICGRDSRGGHYDHGGTRRRDHRRDTGAR